MTLFRKFGPTVSWKRWGSLVFLCGVLSCLLMGCAPTRRASCGGDVPLGYSAELDSLGLAEFLALEPAAVASRRALAGSHLARVRAATRAEGRIRELTTAAGLAPDDPAVWLELAELWRGLGDYLHTDQCLNSAVTAVARLGPGSVILAERGADYKESSALETALQRAWLHYDRAEWRDALPWVRAALRAEPGNEAALQIRGLLAGILGDRSTAAEIAGDLRRKYEFTTDIAWIMSNLETNLGNERAAFNSFLNLRPDDRRVAECYRDMGRSAERVGEWSYASKWYRESAAALPLRKISCLQERRFPPVSEPADGYALPFWLAFDRSYVTGSLSAYLAYAFARFEAAATDFDREAWGGLVVNAAGICLRLEMEQPQVHRIRGRVFARTGRVARALADLKAALAGFGPRNDYLVELEAQIGHLLLLQEKHTEAIVHLKRALAVDDSGARQWSDLGLALIMVGDRAAAGEALTRAILLEPTLAAARYNRGLMYLHAGDLAAAESDLIVAAELAPGNQEIINLLQQVKLQIRQQRTP